MNIFTKCFFLKEKDKESESGSRRDRGLLLYGYAFETPDEPNTWRFRKHGSRVSGRELYSAKSILTRTDFEAFWQNMSGGEAVIETSASGFPPVELTMVEGIVERPDIIVIPKDNEYVSPISSLVFRCKTLFQLNKPGLFAVMGLPFDDNEASIDRILKQLERETGICFTDGQAFRLGNYECYESVCENISALETPPIDWDVLTEEDPLGKTIGVRIDWAKLSAARFDKIFIRLFCRNGQAICADEIHVVNRGDTDIRMVVNQPSCHIKMDFWDANGAYIHHVDSHMIRQIKMDMHLIGQDFIYIDRWAKKIGESFSKDNLPDQVSRVRYFTPEMTSVGEYDHDQWAFIETHVRDLPQPFSKEHEGAEDVFLSKSPPNEYESIRFVISRIQDRGVAEALLVDPYFSPDAAEKLLPRIESTNARLTVVTLATHENPDETMNASDSFNQEYFDTLKESLNRIRSLVRAKVRVLCPNRSDGKKFHDRYLIVYTISGPKVWLLSNSINSLAAKYPFVASKVNGKAAYRLRRYAEGLKSSMESEYSPLLDTIQFVPPPRPERQEGPGGLEIFDHWQDFIKLLLPDLKEEGDEEQLIKKAANRLLTEESGEAYFWQASSTIEASVFENLANAISNPDENSWVFFAIGDWLARQTDEYSLLRRIASCIKDRGLVESAVSSLNGFLDRAITDIVNSLVADENYRETIKEYFEEESPIRQYIMTSHIADENSMIHSGIPWGVMYATRLSGLLNLFSFVALLDKLLEDNRGAFIPTVNIVSDIILGLQEEYAGAMFNSSSSILHFVGVNHIWNTFLFGTQEKQNAFEDRFELLLSQAKSIATSPDKKIRILGLILHELQVLLSGIKMKQPRMFNQHQIEQWIKKVVFDIGSIINDELKEVDTEPIHELVNLVSGQDGVSNAGHLEPVAAIIQSMLPGLALYLREQLMERVTKALTTTSGRENLFNDFYVETLPVVAKSAVREKATVNGDEAGPWFLSSILNTYRASIEDPDFFDRNVSLWFREVKRLMSIYIFGDMISEVLESIRFEEQSEKLRKEIASHSLRYSRQMVRFTGFSSQIERKEVNLFINILKLWNEEITDDGLKAHLKEAFREWLE